MFNNKHTSIQFLRFCTVGAGNTAVDFTTFFLLTLAGVPYLLAQVFSYSAGMVNSFFVNRKWTFGVARKTNVSEIVKFIIVNGLSLLVSFGLLLILHDVIHLDLWLDKLVATGGSMVVNYMGSRLWVFTKHQKQGVKSYEHQKSSHSRNRTGNKISASHKDLTEEMLPIMDKPAI